MYVSHEIIRSFPSIEILSDILNKNLAKPPWTIFRLPFFRLHFKGFYGIGIFQLIW